MRTALALLFLLAAAAAPGSFIPQAAVDAFAVTRWQVAHPELTPWFERLGMFSVYSSVWFSAIYLLLMVSLVGCIGPRLRVYWRAVRARPTASPSHLARLPTYRMVDVWPRSSSTVVDDAATHLRRRRFRVEVGVDGLRAERGYLREAGNLLFHVSILVVLVGFAYGKLFGFTGGVIVVQGQSFGNSLSQYDQFVPGSLFDPSTDFDAFSVDLDSFRAKYLPNGQPTAFTADVSYSASDTPTTEPRSFRMQVNHPLTIDDTNLYLVGHGYAPVVTIKDGNGNTTYAGPVVFLPQDGTFQSFGAIKAPDSKPRQLAFEGDFYPTEATTADGTKFSLYPDTVNPVLSLTAYDGDLGLDSGKPQSVYSLDKSGLTALRGPDNKPLRLDLEPGQTATLPDGVGSISFDGVRPWVKLQVSRSPADPIALGGIVVGLLGVLCSLFVRPRRIWIRHAAGDGTFLEFGGLARGNGDSVTPIVDRLLRELDLQPQTAATTPRPPSKPTGRTQP